MFTNILKPNSHVGALDEYTTAVSCCIMRAAAGLLLLRCCLLTAALVDPGVRLLGSG